MGRCVGHPAAGGGSGIGSGGSPGVALADGKTGDGLTSGPASDSGDGKGCSAGMRSEAVWWQRRRHGPSG